MGKLLDTLRESASALQEASDGYASLIAKKDAQGEDAQQLKEVVQKQRRLAIALDAAAARIASAKRTTGPR